MRLKTLAIAAAVAASGPALAVRVNITGFNPAPVDVKITIDSRISIDSVTPGKGLSAASTLDVDPPPTVTMAAGRIGGYLDLNSFETYCAEIGAPLPHLSPPNAYFSDPGDPYAVVPAPPVFGGTHGAERTADLERLFTAADDQGTHHDFDGGQDVRGLRD